MKRNPPTEKEILEAVWQGEIELPPLTLVCRSAAEIGPTRAGRPVERGRPKRIDLWIGTRWGEREYVFVAQVKARTTPKAFAEALAALRGRADRPSGPRPMLIVPYLRGEQLRELEQCGVSGVDLCGNGVVVVPGELLVFRAGNLNRYRQSFGIRNAYRGASSIVARVFLLYPQYRRVREVWREIRQRGSGVALSTVSKALKRMEEDLIVRRDVGGIRLLQPDRLLERLAQNYRPPKVTQRLLGKFAGTQDDLNSLLWNARQEAGSRLVLTGLGSVGKYAVMAREQPLSAYCSRLASLLDRMGERFTRGGRFANLELLETGEEFVYFDERTEERGFPWASPVQTYLELMQGDKRDQETADQVKRAILEGLENASTAPDNV